MLVLALVVAACGGSDNDAATTEDIQDDGQAGDDPEEVTESADAPDDEDEEAPEAWEASPELIAAAQEEGQFVTYNAIAAELQELLASAFEERYGIEVVYQQVNTSESIERVDAEINAGRVTTDWVTVPNDPWLEDLVGRDEIIELSPEELPALEAVVDDESVYFGHYVRWGGAATVMVWNTDLVSDDEVPDSWCELTEPQWTGRILGTYQPGAVLNAGLYIAMAEECGEDFLAGLGDQDLDFVGGTAQTPARLAAGEYAISWTLPHVVNPLIEEGAPLDWKPVNGTSVSARYGAVLSQAPHPNAARLWMNWMLGPEAQTIAYGNQQGVPVIDGIENSAEALAPIVVASVSVATPEIESANHQAIGAE